MDTSMYAKGAYICPLCNCPGELCICGSFTLPLKNKEQWWRYVDINWSRLLNVIKRSIDLDAMSYNQPFLKESGETGRCIREELEILCGIQNHLIINYFSVAYGEMPAKELDHYAGWKVLVHLLNHDKLIEE